MKYEDIDNLRGSFNRAEIDRKNCIFELSIGLEKLKRELEKAKSTFSKENISNEKLDRNN